MRMLVSAFVLILVASVATAQQPPNCDVGGFTVSPNSTIWVCTGKSTAPTQIVTGGGVQPPFPISDVTNLQTALDNRLLTNANAVSATVLLNARTINGVSFNGSANITVPAAGSTLTDNVTYARGGIGACAATSATTGTMTVTMTAPCHTITPTGAATFNASGGVAGQMATFVISTSGASSFVLTWGTNFRKTGTLATGVTTARFFAVTFLCIDGTIWQEIARTAVQS